MHSILMISILSACSDYDLHRPDDPAKGGETDTAPQEPGDPPDISVTPDSVDFGGLPKGCTATPAQITITNEGLGDLVVSDIALDGDGNSAFSDSWDGAPLTLAYQESATITLSFTPAAWVDYGINLRITSNDPDEGVVDVGATGNGAEDATYEEGFTQDYYGSVDVLWVVDNSGSMGEELNQVATNFSDFIQEWVTLDLDYHLGVVTTDMDNPADSGRLQGPIITPESTDPEADFLAQVDQGDSGSGSERGFDAVKAAFTEPLVSSDNVGFLRDDAALAVIVLSDEDDDSSMSPSQFVSWYQSLKTDSSTVSFSAICGDAGWGCQEFDWSGNTLSASAGTEYIAAVDATGGFWASICTSDYSEVMQQISLSSAGMTVSFPLSQEPSNLASVAVTVEGSSVVNDSSDGWTWDSAANAVVFHGTAIPGPGESVLVSYQVAGECPS